MRNLFYRIRRYMLHERRRYRPGVRNFWLNFRKDLLFRTIVLSVAFIIIIGTVFVLAITVFPDNFIKDMFVNETPSAEISASPEPSPSDEVTPEPEPTVSDTPTPEATITPEPTPEVMIGYITANSGLNVRSGPSSTSADIGGVQKNDRVEIVAIEGDWYKIVYLDGYGYIHSKYVDIVETPTPSPSESPTPEPSETATESPSETPTATP